jgi:HK97 family phage major capsid protein
MDKELKDQLDGLKADLEAKMADSAKAEVLEQLKGINDKMAEVETKAATAKDAEIQELKSTIGKLTADLTATVKGLEILDARVKHSKNAAGPAEVKTWEKAVQEAVDEKHDDLQKFLRKETKKVGIELKAVADFSTANVTGSSVWGAQYRPGIIANPNQIGHMRNFLPTFAAGPGTDYYFMKENGNGEGAPAPTAEKKAASATDAASGLKPSFDMDFVESSVKFETIAGIMPISRKALRNIPGILQFINTRAREKWLDVEDAQILYGTGTSPEISGLFHSGNYTASASTATVFAEQIIDDIAVLEDTYKRAAAFILLRPLEYMNLFKNKASTSGLYDLPSNVQFVNGVLYVGGVPAFKTTALTSGTYAVGAAGGAELHIQENVMIEFFEQDGTNVRTNQITCRIEGTEALPIFGSTYHILGSVAGS